MKLGIVIGLLSVISETIKTVEAQSEAAKAREEELWTGEFKLALAKEAIKDVYNLTNPVVPFETIVASIESAINSLVALYNLLGIFKKKK